MSDGQADDGRGWQEPGDGFCLLLRAQKCLISQNWEVLFFSRMLQGSQLP